MRGAGGQGAGVRVCGCAGVRVCGEPGDLKNQGLRASASIALNLAEGRARQGRARPNHCRIALGSAKPRRRGRPPLPAPLEPEGRARPPLSAPREAESRALTHRPCPCAPACAQRAACRRSCRRGCRARASPAPRPRS
ncbi:MAG: four helix bundle protein [Deltaproteobacteria bacterium]|nr:MAG: four helix bundle protein [Deltaproteobacteria bacterium]